MATATGDVAYNFAAAANENPWSLADGGVGDPFVVRNGMTARIITNALRSDFNSNGYCCYVAQAIDQNDFEVKGETLQGGGSFGDQVGVGAINSSGNGYILWINGNLWRIYQIDAFVIGAGTNLTLSHAALDVISLQYSYSGGTATLTAKQNGSTVGLSVADSTSPYNGDLQPCWFFNFDNANAGGFRSIAFDGLAVAGVTIDDTPTDNRVTESRTIRATAPTTAITTGNTSIYINADTNAAITPTAVAVVSGLTVDINYTVPDEYAGLKYGATGYPIIVDTVDGQATSANVPYLPVTGNGYIDATSVPGDFNTLLGVLAIGDQVEYETNSGEISVGADLLITSDNPNTTFSARAWDATDSTWGDWALQTLGTGGGGGGNGGLVIEGLTIPGLTIDGLTL